MNLQFLYPNMLWGLLAVLIPIAVHLFNFRKHKQVYFSNTAVLRNIQQENAKTRKLKYFVTLCLRCLFVIAMVLAFAFPYRPEKQLNTNSDNSLVGIYLDNSMSMKSQSERTTLLEDARQSARDLVRKLNPSSRFVLMTNCFEVQNEFPMNQDEMLDQLDRMNQEGTPVAMGDVLDRFAMLRKQHGFASSTMFAYSDFQQNTFDLSSANPDSAMQMVIVPMVSENTSNLYVDTVWLTSPILQVGLPNTLNVKVVNESDKNVKGLPIGFMMNGNLAASATVDVEKDNSADLELQFVVEQGGEQRCSVSLMDYPITFDDDYRFVLNVKPCLNVVELGTESTDCKFLFADDEQFNYVLMDPSRFDLGLLSKAQLIIVNEMAALNETLQQTLMDYVAEGSSLVVFPNVSNPKQNTLLYNGAGLNPNGLDANPTKVENLALQHAFFTDVVVDLPEFAELPMVMQHISLKTNGLSTPLLTLQNGDPFLFVTPQGKGNVFVFSTALNDSWSDLSSNPLFVPVMLKMVLMGAQVGQLSYTIGIDKLIIVNDLSMEGDHSFALCTDDQSYVIRPAAEQRNQKTFLYLNDDLPKAGFCDLVVNDTVNRTLAWNDSRVESSMEFVPRDEVEQIFRDSGFDVVAVLDVADFATHDLVDAMAHQSSIWKWFVLIALLALLGEIAVLRFWK